MPLSLAMTMPKMSPLPGMCCTRSSLEASVQDRDGLDLHQTVRVNQARLCAGLLEQNDVKHSQEWGVHHATHIEGTHLTLEWTIY